MMPLSALEPRDSGPRLRSAVGTAAILGAIAAVQPLAAQRDARAPDEGELRVTLLHTSDEHSAVLPAPLVEYRAGHVDATRGGFARLASVVEDVRRRKAQNGEPVLLTSAGDHTGGSPFSWLMLYGEAPELTLMVEMGYDVITLGNHEFDHGPEQLAAALAAAGFPSAAHRTTLVATNTRPPGGHALGERGLRRTHLDTLPNGLRVGFIGLIGRGAVRVAPSAAPVEFENAHESAAVAVTELRSAGAQLIVALTHSGIREDRALARAVPDIDVILGGHDHRLVDEPMIEGETIIIHPGASLRQVLMLELSYEPRRGAVRVRNGAGGSPFVIRLDGNVAESPTVAARITGYRRQLEAQIAELTGGRFSALDATIVHSSFALGGGGRSESPLGNFVADAMRAVAGTATGARVDFAFQANGNLRGEVVPERGAESGGRILFHDLAGVVGMGSGPDGTPGYPMISAWLSGDEVQRVLELSILLSEVLGGSYFLQVSGLRARYDPRRAVLFRIPASGTPIPTGRAVLSVERDSAGTWVPLARGDGALYHVVTDRYVASFLPMVGRLVPRLAVVPKDASGAPIESIDHAIIMRDGRTLAVWQAVLEFAAAQPRDAAGEARIPERYAAPEGRLVVDRGVPLWIVPLTVLLVLIIGAAVLVMRVRRRRRSATRGSA